MIVRLDRDTYVLDQDGSTYGVSSTGEFTLTGEISQWIRLIGSWVLAGDDVLARADSLEPARAEQVRRVYQTMFSLGVLTNEPPTGEVHLLGETDVSSWALERNSRPLPECHLAVGALPGLWLQDAAVAAPDAVFGAVLLVAREAVVLGPVSGEQLSEILVAFEAAAPPAGRPDDAVIRAAVAQVIRRLARGGLEPSRATTVTSDGSERHRISPHPWQSGRAAIPGTFDERVMAVIDRQFGAIRSIDESDLPQVPRHLTRIRVAGDAVFNRTDTEIVADGADFDSARRSAVLRGLAARAESTPDPRRVIGLDGAPAATASANFAEMREAIRSVQKRPTVFTVPGRRLTDDVVVPVKVSDVFALGDGSRSDIVAVADETADEALREALLLVVEATVRSERDADGPEIEVSTLPHDLSVGWAPFSAADPSARIILLPGVVPSVAVRSNSGSTYGCGVEHAEAVRRALARATVAAQYGTFQYGSIHTRKSATTGHVGSAGPVPLPQQRALCNADLTAAVLALHPGLTVVDLDHDPLLGQLGLIVRKVVLCP